MYGYGYRYTEGKLGGGSAFTPLSLENDLLKWMDASDTEMTVVEPVNGGYFWYDKSQWVDGPQLSFVSATGSLNPSTYSNDTLIFDGTSNEVLWMQSQATFYNRSTGEWWFVVDHVPGTDQGLWIMTDQADDNVLWACLIISNKFRYSTATGGAFTVTDTTTTLSAGRNVIRFASLGSSFIYELNGVDLSSELTNNDGRWEDIYDWDRCAFNAKLSPTPIYYTSRLKQVVRTVSLNEPKSQNLYNFLRTR